MIKIEEDVHQLKGGALIFVTGNERVTILNQNTIRNMCRDRNKGQELESLEPETI